MAHETEPLSQDDAPVADERTRGQATRKNLLQALRDRRRERDSAEFIAEAQRQSLAIAQSAQEAEDLDFVESISIFRARGKR